MFFSNDEISLQVSDALALVGLALALLDAPPMGDFPSTIAHSVPLTPTLFRPSEMSPKVATFVLVRADKPVDPLVAHARPTLLPKAPSNLFRAPVLSQFRRNVLAELRCEFLRLQSSAPALLGFSFRLLWPVTLLPAIPLQLPADRRLCNLQLLGYLFAGLAAVALRLDLAAILVRQMSTHDRSLSVVEEGLPWRSSVFRSAVYPFALLRLLVESRLLTTPEFGIVPKEALDEAGNVTNLSVTSGAYTASDVNARTQTLRLTKNKFFRRAEREAPEEINLTFIRDLGASTALDNFDFVEVRSTATPMAS